MSDDALGPVIATHRYSTEEERNRVHLWTVVVGVGGLIAVAGQPLGVFLAAGGALYVAVQLALIAGRQRRFGGSRIDRHEGGLTIEMRGAEPVIVSWNELGPLHAHRARFDALDRKGNVAVVISPWFALTGEREAKNLWTYVVQAGPVSLSLDRHWSEVNQLVDAIRKHRQRLCLPEAKRAIEAGQSVRFGPFEVDPEALQLQGRRLGWDDFVDLAMQQGIVAVRRKPAGRFGVVDLREVPDVDVLIELTRWVPARRTSYR